MMKRGHPKKSKGNISGLKNQKASPVPSHPSSRQSASPASGFDQDSGGRIVAEASHHIAFDCDSTRINWEEEDMAPLNSDLDDQIM